jgi:site-specific recombinase XerD
MTAMTPAGAAAAADVPEPEPTTATIIPLRPPGGGKPSIEEILDDHAAWMRLRGLSESTIYIRRRIVNMVVIRHLQATDLAQVTARALATWQRAQTNLAAQSHSTYVIQLQEFFKWAVAEEYLEADPTGRLVRPKLPRRLPRPIGEDDLQLAIDAAIAPRLRAWLVLAAYAGLRASEIAAMRREDVLDQQDPPVLVVRNGKGGKDRVVPASPMVLEALAPFLSRMEYLFEKQDHQTVGSVPVRGNNVSQVSNAHLRTLGIPSTIHKLRHRFATQLYAGTKDLRLVQEMLGHESPTTTAIYTAYSPNEASAAVTQLGQTSGRTSEPAGEGTWMAVTLKDGPQRNATIDVRIDEQGFFTFAGNRYRIDEPSGSALRGTARLHVQTAADGVFAAVLREVAREFGYTVDELVGPSRSRSGLTFARHVAMYLCRQLTDQRLAAIGEHFGGRAADTVAFAEGKVHRLMEDNPALGDRLGMLSERATREGDR